MAALCPGVQYGLSSQQNFGENKDLIFVRLTDSALRAIEEYIKNQNKLSCQSPTIKFLGNTNGELSFPSTHHDSGCTAFSFSMSSTSDMEGPGGSFECIQQLGSFRGPLESLGSIPYKIRVHANEDVYEVTRNRMTEAEDKYKNKCTREIKPNQTDIGRKVKVKQTAARPPPPRPSMRDSLLKQPPAYQPSVPPPKPSAHVHSTNGLSNGLGSNHVSSTRPVQHNKRPLVPDIARRPLKERLIHLLALRPFNKFELHDRLTKEGLREKSSMTSVLKQISNLKENCFHLNRAMWNEVHEDWPFYTETEKQMLKRRKPQGLTPPGSSDGGSSGSGQSPTSTHPGSPPPPISTSTKRPGFHDGPDGFPYKRQRIAHGGSGTTIPNKTIDPPPYRQQPSPLENNSQRRPVTDLRDASNMNPRSRESPTNEYFGSYATLNDNDETNEKKRQCDSHNSLSYGVNREKTFRSSSACSPTPIGGSRLMTDEARKEGENRRENGHMVNGVGGREKERRNKVTSSTPRISRVSPDSQTDSFPPVVVDSEPPLVKVKVEEEDEEFPDYKKQYVTIETQEQRRRYKLDFNADYAEYRELHGIVEKVSRRFAQLEERLKQEDESSPRFKDIKKQIVREYHENKKDLDHQKAKRRFQYLHEKLSHIKRLVAEYDHLQGDGGDDSHY